MARLLVSFVVTPCRSKVVARAELTRTCVCGHGALLPQTRRSHGPAEPSTRATLPRAIATASRSINREIACSLRDRVLAARPQLASLSWVEGITRTPENVSGEPIANVTPRVQG